MPSLHFSARTMAACYVLLSLLVLLAFATPLGYAWGEYVEEDRTRILQADSQRLQRVFDEQGPVALAAAIQTQVGASVGASDDIVILADASLQRLAGNLPDWPAGIGQPAGLGRYSIAIDGRMTRILARHLVLGQGYHLLVAQDIDRYRLLENLFIYGLGGAASVIICLGAAGGLLVRRRLLAKVKDINQAASAIMQGHFSHRLPRHGGEDELAVLVDTENRMLAQIEHLMEGMRHVSNAIAHDLRTPLAELRSRLEALLRDQADGAPVATEVEAAIADVDRVIAIFNALLRLAEIDTGARRSGFLPVDLATVVEDATEFYLPLAESRQRRLDTGQLPRVRLMGDPLLLSQAIGNLIDNALKYGVDGGTVQISCGRLDNGMVFVEVLDDGPGIAEQALPRVQERFYRCDTSRATPGMGLGLSVVAAVARLHDGRLELRNASPGLRAVLLLQARQVNDPSSPGNAPLTPAGA